jgi:hypothetical protein
MQTPDASTQTPDFTTPSSIDEGLGALTARAEALYLRIFDLNLTFQEDTAAEKVTKDQSGKVTN